MNKYWVCVWESYYPEGGLGNAKRTFSNAEEAIEYAKAISRWEDEHDPYDYTVVYDISSMLEDASGKPMIVWELT